MVVSRFLVLFSWDVSLISHKKCKQITFLLSHLLYLCPRYRIHIVPLPKSPKSRLSNPTCMSPFTRRLFVSWLRSRSSLLCKNFFSLVYVRLFSWKLCSRILVARDGDEIAVSEKTAKVEYMRENGERGKNFIEDLYKCNLPTKKQQLCNLYI